LLVEALGVLGSLDDFEVLDQKASNCISKSWCIFCKTSCWSWRAQIELLRLEVASLLLASSWWSFSTSPFWSARSFVSSSLLFFLEQFVLFLKMLIPNSYLLHKLFDHSIRIFANFIITRSDIIITRKSIFITKTYLGEDETLVFTFFLSPFATRHVCFERLGKSDLFVEDSPLMAMWRYHKYLPGLGAQQLRWPMRPGAALVRVPVGCMFMWVVSESETYRIYEAVLQTIKAVTRNLSGAANFIT
jgi:hypothetical protein